MFKFETKKKIREERDAALSALAEAVRDKNKLDLEKAQIKENLDFEKGKTDILTQNKADLENEIKNLKKKDASKEKRLVKMRKTVLHQSAKVTNLMKKNKELESDICKARGVIENLNKENTKLKARPTLEQLKNEKVIRREKRNK
ncbi:MAG: hypothetical protein K2G03_03395 [Bacilli bacterium]|nr:hypothetical protein [Bacilli bacterium]